MQVCNWMDSKSIQCEALCRRKPLLMSWARMAGPRHTTDAQTNEYGLFLSIAQNVWERGAWMQRRTVGSVYDPLPRPCRDRVYGMSQSNWAPTHGLRHTGEIERGLSKPSEIRWNMRNPCRSVSDEVWAKTQHGFRESLGPSIVE